MSTFTTHRKDVKFLPGYPQGGHLDENARHELLHLPPVPDTPDLTTLRIGMGWASRDISHHALAVKNQQINGVCAIRSYRRLSAKGAVPALVFFHGGGFFGGSLDNVDHACRAIADATEVMVISVHYALAPEHQWPAGLLDCYRAVCWVHQHADALNIDPERIVVGGDSAGGNLALTSTLLDRMFETYYINAQVLIYPTVLRPDPQDTLADLGPFGIAADHMLISEYIRGFAALDAQVNRWYLSSPERQRTLPLVSPLLSPDLSRLPATFIIVGEFDPLRLQCEALYQALIVAGIEVDYLQYNGMVHAFMDKVGDFPQAADLACEVSYFVAGCR